ncbi:MAG: alpha-amylase [Alphaproteobacteria bacterium]|nr:alpha-amylase [Alphaproteobacteria bacterium]
MTVTSLATCALLALTTLSSACAPSPYIENPDITTEVDDWRDEVIYQVIVDRFANGDVNNDFNVTHDPTNLNRYMGGDWQGLIDRVDYLQALGVTAIWISPVVMNVEEDAGIAGYHGYWTQSFNDVNPHFGDLAKLRELVDVMHAHGIKVIVDIVTNHVGQLFYYDINQNGQADITTWYATDGSDTLDIVTEWDPGFDGRTIQSWTSLGYAGDAPLGWVDMPELNRRPPSPPEFRSDDWYHKMGRVTDWSDLDQVVYGDFPGGLKDLATENPNVRAGLIRVFQDWITKTNIDGYRIDTVKHIEHDFWSEFCPAIRDHAAVLGKEQFLMFGEVFDGDDTLLGSYTQDDMLDSLVYFSQKYWIYDGVFKRGDPTSKLDELYGMRAVNWGAEPQPGGIGLAPRDIPINFMDNHDVGRFLFDKDSEDALASAIAFLMTQEGVPLLYYGTEQGFAGGNDPANREPLWPSGYDTDGDLFVWTAGLTALRAAHEPLRRGDFTLTWTSPDTGSAPGAHMLAFERSTDTETVLVVLNTSDEHTNSTADAAGAMETSFPSGTTLTVAFPPTLEGQTWTVGGDGALEVSLPPRGVAVLVE